MIASAQQAPPLGQAESDPGVAYTIEKAQLAFQAETIASRTRTLREGALETHGTLKTLDGLETNLRREGRSFQKTLGSLYRDPTTAAREFLRAAERDPLRAIALLKDHPARFGALLPATGGRTAAARFRLPGFTGRSAPGAALSATAAGSAERVLAARTALSTFVRTQGATAGLPAPTPAELRGVLQVALTNTRTLISTEEKTLDGCGGLVGSRNVAVDLATRLSREALNHVLTAIPKLGILLRAAQAIHRSISQGMAKGRALDGP